MAGSELVALPEINVNEMNVPEITNNRSEITIKQEPVTIKQEPQSNHYRQSIVHKRSLPMPVQSTKRQKTVHEVQALPQQIIRNMGANISHPPGTGFLPTSQSSTNATTHLSAQPIIHPNTPVQNNLSNSILPNQLPTQPLPGLPLPGQTQLLTQSAPGQQFLLPGQTQQLPGQTQQLPGQRLAQPSRGGARFPHARQPNFSSQYRNANFPVRPPLMQAYTVTNATTNPGDMPMFQQPEPNKNTPKQQLNPHLLRHRRKKEKTKYFGVYYDPFEERYFGRFKFEGGTFYTDIYFDAICAAKAYDDKIREVTNHLGIAYQDQVNKYLNFPNSVRCCTDDEEDFYFIKPMLFPSTRGGLFLVWGANMYHNDKRENEGYHFKFRCREKECGEVADVLVIDGQFMKWVRTPNKDHTHPSNFTKPLRKKFAERFQRE